MSLIPPIPDRLIVDKNGKLLSIWQTWLGNVYSQFLVTVGQNGTTAQRPTTNLWVNQQYFDSTLGKPIWIKSLNPTVWVDATGSSV